MNDFAKRIQRNITKKRVSGQKIFEEILFNLTKKTSMSIGDIVEAPTPLVIELNNKLFKYYQEKAKAMKKKK